ncbi:DUF2637 domain-containing protein [Planobispora rosea]|uniref:DUF2637 domain-containing protein n=1 Tax=Planobispora rosea TaxID=35762 RepID=UPI00083A3DEC|nr:DUF2637 domain-containing protein [Planobispora rosea]
MNDSPVRADRWIRWTTTASVVLLAAIAAIVSYRHMHELALRHGESELGAVLAPLAVDGMIVASSMSILLASRYGRRGGVLPWGLLIAGSLASLGANIAVADPTMIARIIAAWPSFALIGAYEMLMVQIRQGHAVRELVNEPTNGSGVNESIADAEGKCRDLRREAWQWALANRCPDGGLPSGRTIAVRFSRSARWGRWIKNAGLAGELE